MQLNMPFYESPDDTIDNEDDETDDGSQVNPNLEQDNNTIEEDNPEEVDGEEDDTDEGNDEGGDKSSSNLYSSLATVVYEQGLLPSLDIEKIKDIKDVDGLVEAFKVEKELLAKQQLDEYIANLDTTSVVQAKKALTDLESITEDTLKDNLELAKQIIYEDYINQGVGEAKATRYLKRILDLGEDAILEEAADSLVSAKEFQTRQIEEAKINSVKEFENQKAEQAKLDEQLRKTVYESTDLIKGFKPTKALQDKVYKSINDIVGKSPEGYFENKFMRERRENPLEFETRMYMFYELTNGFKDYSKVQSSAKSSAVKDLEKIAQQTKIKDNGTPIWMQDDNSYGGVGHVLNI
jgi:hypothetical protein